MDGLLVSTEVMTADDDCELYPLSYQQNASNVPTYSSLYVSIMILNAFVIYLEL
uniref:Uncharacterized protein n=1 Tax=Arion vulgaris TaxID=1028688 RepID=A0A0B6XY25_9EUPU